ncbi:structural maintenance of chromosomes protein 4 isoform X1 [Lampetra fluviatilis]
MSPMAKASTAKRRGNKDDDADDFASEPLASEQAPISDAAESPEDRRTLQEILESIPSAPPAAMTNEPGAPRLMITHIVNENFKSYAGKQVLGPFHKRFSCIIGPNGSGKSNVIDSMLFVFGYRAQKIRSKKLSVLIHNSEAHPDLYSCTVEVHFQKIVDKEGDDFEVIPGSEFFVSRSATKDSVSSYTVSGHKATFRDVGQLLRSHGIDLDHNRFLILQGEVEQIALMKPKAQTEHDEGMLEYMEDIIGSGRFKPAIEACCRRVEQLNELRGEKLNRVKVVEKEKDGLEAEKNNAVAFLMAENEITKLRNSLLQHKMQTARKALATEERKKADIDEASKDLREKMAELVQAKKGKAKELQTIDKKLDKIKAYIEEHKKTFVQYDLQDVKMRENLKNCASKEKKLAKQLVKDADKLKEIRNVPAASDRTIKVSTDCKAKLEASKSVEEEKLKSVMANFEKETKGLQEEKEVKQQELLSLSKEVNERRSRMEVAQSELDLYMSRHTSALAALNETKQALTSTTEGLCGRRENIRKLEATIPSTEKELAQAQQELEKLAPLENAARAEVRALRQKTEEAKSSLCASRSRNKVLQLLMDQKNKGSLPGIYGRLGDLGAIEEKYDVAISSCCSALDNIVVDTMDTAQACVTYLKTNNIGSATFIGLDKMRVWQGTMKKSVQGPEGVLRLFDLVRVGDEAVRTAFYFTLRDTLVANNLEQASRVAFQHQRRWRVVTLQGQVIETSGTMSGGGTRVMKGRMGSSVVNEVPQEEVERMEHKLQEESAKMEQYQQQRSQLEERVQTLQTGLRDMKYNLQKLSAGVKVQVEQEVSLKLQVKELEANVVAAAPDKNQLKKLEKTLEGFKKEYEKVSSQTGKIEAEVKRIHGLIMEIMQGRLKTQQDKVDKINQQIDECVSDITKAQVALKTADRNLKKAEEALAKTEREQEENRQAIVRLNEEVKSLEEAAAEILKESTHAQERENEVSELKRELMGELKALSEEEQGYQKEELAVRLKVEQFDTKISELNSMLKHFNKELSKFKLHVLDDEGEAPVLPTLGNGELEELEDPVSLANKITILEEKTLQMKPNLGAISDYKKKEEIYLQRVSELDAITAQRDEFRHSYEDLRKSRLQDFMAGFNVITNKLKENYQMLTQGGDAELELVDSLDPFSEGIVFSVRPPKKSWKKIFNLSGGEKTLSSLALVFALHHYKPTPLYFMDEIDAALDFKNVSIVALYVYEQTKNAQFIIISLRNNMFEMSDRLIGIYKTNNTTKSVAINPKTIVLPPLPGEATMPSS